MGLLGPNDTVFARRQHGLADGLLDLGQDSPLDDMDQRPGSGLGAMLLLQGN